MGKTVIIYLVFFWLIEDLQAKVAVDFYCVEYDCSANLIKITDQAGEIIWDHYTGSQPIDFEIKPIRVTITNNSGLIYYKLGGFESDWQNTSESNSIVYYNLAQGSYRLLFNQAGTGKENQLSFKVIAPMWQSPWFKMLMVVLIVGLLLVYNHFRHQSRIKKLVNQQNFSVYKNHLIKKDLARSFHDDFGNRIVSISAFVEMANQRLTNNDQELKLLLGKIDEQAKNLFSGTKDLVWAFESASDNLEACYCYIKDDMEVYFEKNDINFIANQSIEATASLAPGLGSQLIRLSKSIMKIFGEMRGGTIWLDLTGDQRWFHLEIVGNGGELKEKQLETLAVLKLFEDHFQMIINEIKNNKLRLVIKGQLSTEMDPQIFTQNKRS